MLNYAIALADSHSTNGLKTNVHDLSSLKLSCTVLKSVRDKFYSKGSGDNPYATQLCAGGLRGVNELMYRVLREEHAVQQWLPCIMFVCFRRSI